MKRKEAIKKTREGVVQIFNDYHPSTKEIKKFLKEAFPDDTYLQTYPDDISEYLKNRYFEGLQSNRWYSLNAEIKNKKVINLSTITKRKKTKLSQLEKQFSDLAKDVAELRQIIAKDVEVDAEEVKNELIVGEWYKWKYSKANLIFRITKIDKTHIHYYGIEEGEWSESSIHKDNDFEKATPQEVQTALINHYESKNKPFEKYKYHFEGGLKGELYGWNGNKDAVKLLEEGIWTEIIQQETIKEEEIDFSVPQLLISHDKKEIVSSTGIHNDSNFSGLLIYANGSYYAKNDFSNEWFKGSFNSFKGELTIK